MGLRSVPQMCILKYADLEPGTDLVYLLRECINASKFKLENVMNLFFGSLKSLVFLGKLHEVICML